jgi:hypothetical protein
MQTTVGEHIRKLEERLELLNTQVMEDRIALAERAIRLSPKFEL